MTAKQIVECWLHACPTPGDAGGPCGHKQCQVARAYLAREMVVQAAKRVHLECCSAAGPLHKALAALEERE